MNHLLYVTDFATRPWPQKLINRGLPPLLTEREERLKAAPPILLKDSDADLSLSVLARLYPLTPNKGDT